VPVAQRDRQRRRHGRVMRFLRGMPVVLGAVVLATAVGCAPATPPATPSPTGSAATGVSTPDPVPPSSAPTLSPGGAAGGGLVVGGGGLPMPPPGACHAGTLNGQPLPDTACTPGEISAVVTQASIGSTICKSGWTATVRPSVAVTDAIKTKSAQAYGLSSRERGELDHDIPLELGGHPRATAPGRGGCRRRYAAKPDAPSATPGACSRRGAGYRRAGGSGLCRPGRPGRRAAGRGNQHRSAHPADALPSAEAALLGRVYPHRTGSPTPRPSTPDTPRPLPPPVVRAKTLLQHPRAFSHYVALVYVAVGRRRGAP